MTDLTVPGANTEPGPVLGEAALIDHVTDHVLIIFGVTH